MYFSDSTALWGTRCMNVLYDSDAIHSQADELKNVLKNAQTGILVSPVMTTIRNGSCKDFLLLSNALPLFEHMSKTIHSHKFLTM
jgi:hypothetical protein